MMDSLRQVRKLIFIDNLSDAERALKNRVDDDLFIALKPVVYVYLKKKGVEVNNTLPYFGIDGHKSCSERSDAIISWIRGHSEFIDFGMDLKEAYSDIFTFWIRFSNHYCLWLIEIILNAIEKHNPRIISAHISGKRFVRSFYLEPEERCLGIIIKLLAEYKNISWKDLSDKKTVIPDVYICGFMRILDGLYEVGKFTVAHLKHIYWKRFRRVPKGTVSFTTKFYQMDKLASDIDKKSSLGVSFLRAPIVSRFRMSDIIIKMFMGKQASYAEKQRQLFTNLENEITANEEVFSYRNINFAGIIKAKIHSDMVDYIVGLVVWTPELSRVLDLMRPSLILSNANRADDRILARMCGQKNIPILLISHGSHVLPKNRWEEIEWGEHGRYFLRAPYSYLALQSPLCEDYLKVFPSNSKLLKTGPLIWGRPVDADKSRLWFEDKFGKGCKSGDVKIIMHAASPKAADSLRFYVYETSDEYIQSICELAEAVEKMVDVILIVKFRPSSEISVDTLKSIVPFSEKVILDTESSFQDVLGVADLLVSFSSTTIEEALQNKIPVLLYGGEGRYQHISAFEVMPDKPISPSAVYHVVDAETLKYAIKGIFDAGAGDKKEDLFAPYVYSSDKIERLEEFIKF